MLLRNQLYAGSSMSGVPACATRGDHSLLNEEVFFRLRALRVVRPRADRELVGGPKRLLRLLPLPASTMVQDSAVTSGQFKRPCPR